eukprot:TRINITY_DN6385_c0_g1_i1.p1 TRINITY_DN6385_c0_g1~~TRINITY_DN6385_c0_g1_i1.p1  ORF type:complete len:607 (-),score=165.25 TRINITY_DN6385_c0_g1_i1:314-2107(-)
MGKIELINENVLIGRSLETMKKLLAMNQVDMNLTDEYGRNPIYIACKMGNLELVIQLLKSSLTQFHLSKYVIALTHACDTEEPNLKLIKYLLEEGGKIDSEPGQHLSGMYYAGYYANTDLMNYLLKLRSKDIQRCLFGASNCFYNEDYLAYSQMDPIIYQQKIEANQKMVKFLIEKGARVDKLDDFFKKPALYFASKSKRLDLVKLMLESKDLPENLAPLLNKALSAQFDIDRPSTEIVKYFIEKGASPNLKNDNDVSILSYAISKNNLELVEFILQKGGKPQDRGNKFLVERESSFLNACSKGDLETAKLLLNNGSSAKETDHLQQSAMYYSSRTSDDSFFTFLYEKGCRDFNGALLSACKSGNNKIDLKKLISLKADVNTMDQFNKTPLYYSSYNGNLDQIKVLVENGASTQFDEAFGISCLTSTDENILRFLINSGNCNMDSLPISYCKSKIQKNIEFLSFLIDSKADINAIDNERKTALYYASHHINLDFMKFLIEKGVEEISFSLLAVSGLSDKFSLNVAKFMIGHKADPNFRDPLDEDKSCLYYACEKSNIPMIDLLIKSGANDLDYCLYYASSKKFKGGGDKIIERRCQP